MLLVRHRHDELKGGASWWVPPGGGVERGESLLECARRETLEETGLRVVLGRIVYVREFVEPGYHHCEVFFAATVQSGTLKVGKNPGVGVFDVDHLIEEVRFVPKDEMAGMTIYPEEIKTTLWDDLASGFAETRYLSLRRSETKTYLPEQAEGDGL